MRYDIPPVAMSFWRWLLAGLILLPFVARDLRRHWPVVRRSWRLLTVLGLISVTTFNTLCYVALQWTTATNGTLFNSIIPVLIVAIGWTVLREPLSLRQGVGVIVSLAGALIIVSRGNPAVLLGLEFNRGDLLLIVAMTAWALYTVLLRWRPVELSGLPFLACIVYFGLPVLGLAYAMELAAGRTFILTPATAATFAYYAVFPSILSNLSFNRGVAAVGPNRAGIFIHLMPVFGILLSALLLGERPALYHLAGMALVFCGIWLSSTVRFGARSAAGDL